MFKEWAEHVKVTTELQQKLDSLELGWFDYVK